MSAIITLSLLAILVLYLGLFKAHRALLPVSVVGLVAAVVLYGVQWGITAKPLYSGMVFFDHFAVAFSVICVVLTALVLLLSKDYFDKSSPHVAESYALILFSDRTSTRLNSSHY